jgi:uncharacterized protein
LFILAVALSVLALAMGPMLVGFGRGHAFVDGVVHVFTLVVAPTIVIAAILPHLYEELGALGPALVAVGYCAFWLSERHGEHVAHIAASILMPALTVHSLVDGASLALALRSAAGIAPPLLALALVVHRLPEGLFIGKALLPRIGALGTAGCVCLLAIATVTGAAMGGQALSRLNHDVLHAIVAAGIGAILRSLLHRRSLQTT